MCFNLTGASGRLCSSERKLALASRLFIFKLLSFQKHSSCCSKAWIVWVFFFPVVSLFQISSANFLNIWTPHCNAGKFMGFITKAVLLFILKVTTSQIAYHRKWKFYRIAILWQIKSHVTKGTVLYISNKILVNIFQAPSEASLLFNDHWYCVSRLKS